ncbi:hypothetical protein [Candidatus Amarolinea dominans]|uniref:aspartate-alanine antiporter-like transporter n=1 Tax=Candidatus Amarolinea dominans TaxID=3140696 RepID=UPI0031CCC331
MLIFATVLVGAVGTALRLSPGVTTGMFTGSFTNTAALAAALEYIKSAASPQLVQQMLAESRSSVFSSPTLGVIGMILVITVLRRVWKIDYAAEASCMTSIGQQSASGQSDYPGDGSGRNRCHDR